MKRLILHLMISFCTIFLSSQSIEIPYYTGEIIEREFYTLKYNEKFEQAEWVAYELTRDEVLGSTKRKDTFKADPSINTGSATLYDYKGSGYDRGHLAPAADMKMSSKSMSESFYMSNMSPQAPGFNRGIWSLLESYVRTWAYENESLYIVTGPVLTKDNYPTIGSNNVAIPEYYYKVILDFEGDEIKAIGFILPNKKSSKKLVDYAVTVDEVEEFTGIDFFHQLEDNYEYALESVVDVDEWSFKQFHAPESEIRTDSGVTKTNMPYWITTTNKRHNSSCRYYENTKNGYHSDEPIGEACSICGG